VDNIKGMLLGNNSILFLCKGSYCSNWTRLSLILAVAMSDRNALRVEVNE
jgi:hypothetical protein